MASPIRTKNQIDGAPTPQNTPASLLKDSFLKNGNPLLQMQQASRVPQTINEEDISAALARNPELLATIQGKLGSLVGQDSGYVSSLPQKVKEKIFALKKLQRDIFHLEKEFQLEMFELENKYLQKYAPIHERRAEIIKGTVEPTKEEIETGKALEEDEEDEEEPEQEDEQQQESHDEDDENLKGIPSFWLTALENLPMISQTITDRDAELLDHLVNVSMEYLTDGKPGFKLIFEFEENEYFTNKQLVKTYYYQPELGYSGDFIYDHAEGTEINWTSNDKNVTVLVEKRKQRNRTTKQVRTIEKITPVESFFNFFDPPSIPASTCCPEGDHGDGDESHPHTSVHCDDDEHQVNELESRLAVDYAIGEEIKDKLIPRAVDWFTGVAREFDYDDEEDEYEEEDEDDEDDDDDEEDGLDEEDELDNLEDYRVAEADEEDSDAARQRIPKEFSSRSSKQTHAKNKDQDDDSESDDFADMSKEQAPECKQS